MDTTKNRLLCVSSHKFRKFFLVSDETEQKTKSATKRNCRFYWLFNRLEEEIKFTTGPQQQTQKKELVAGKKSPKNDRNEKRNSMPIGLNSNHIKRIILLKFVLLDFLSNENHSNLTMRTGKWSTFVVRPFVRSFGSSKILLLSSYLFNVQRNMKHNTLNTITIQQEQAHQSHFSLGFSSIVPRISLANFRFRQQFSISWDKINGNANGIL